VKLTSRVSIFFLVALAVVLAANSLVLYVTVRGYLNAEFDDRLMGALQVLSASIEVEPEDVTWYPEEYTLDFESKMLQDARWIIANEHGGIVEHSPKISRDSPNDLIIVQYGCTRYPRHNGIADVEGWKIVQRYHAAPSPQSVETRESNEHASLLVTVAMSRQELTRDLSRLANTLIFLPLVIWTAAAIAGRTYVGRALQPLRKMAWQAESAVGADFDLRLPSPHTNDELSELAGSFNALIERLQREFHRQRDFSSHAAHQLRTPLTILQGELDVALRRPRGAEEYRACLETLRRVSHEMTQIVESLLLLARHEHPATASSLEVFDLSQWLPSYRQRWQHHARFADLQFQVDEMPVVRATEPLLTQLLDNLIHNALLYSRPQSAVTVHVRPHGRQVEFAIRDQGIGVKAEDREAIFEPFVRTRHAQTIASGGAGLGLAVAQQLARVLGGHVELRESSMDRGSVFVLVLPADFAT
jgi:signal transduction histidine kinase